MTNTELITLRMNILGGMNEYVLNNVQDENMIVNDWFMVRFPDCATEEDLRTIAEDEELWLDAINSFARCMKYC